MPSNSSADAAVREATGADHRALLALIQAYHRFEAIESTEEHLRVALTGILDQPSVGKVWVAEVDGELVGYAVLTLGYSLEYGGRDGFLDELFIAEPIRGQSIGKTLLEQLVKGARAAGVRALHLEVAHDNARAQQLYRAAGFEGHGRTLLSKDLLSDQ